MPRGSRGTALPKGKTWPGWPVMVQTSVWDSQAGMGLQERNSPEGGPLVPMFPGLGLQQQEADAGTSQDTALAGRSGSRAQLVGVMGIFAVVGAQVVAKAERSPLVTLTGLLLAGSCASWMGQESQGRRRRLPALRHARDRSGVHILSTALLVAPTHQRMGKQGRAQRPGGPRTGEACGPVLAVLPSPPNQLACLGPLPEGGQLVH